jgi:hypothetical protein
VISDALNAKIREEAGNRCGYCLTHQDYIPWLLEVEHLLPKSKGGKDDEENLWLACRSCNLYKTDQTEGFDPLTGRYTPLFNPRRQKWKRHFQWSQDGVFIIGRTVCGRATVLALNLNNLVAVTVRRNWVKAGWHPPK